jgi:hypothetical protein
MIGMPDTKAGQLAGLLVPHCMAVDGGYTAP